MKSQGFTKAELIEQNDNLRTKVANLEYKLANHHFPETSTIISQNDFSAILENNADGILIIDEEGIVMYVNPAAEMIFDRKKKEFIGIQFGFPLTNEGLQEIVIFKKGGLYVEAELRLVPITWRNKPGYQLSVRDISQHKIEEEERIKNETLIKAAVDNLPIIFYIIDAEGKFRLSIGAGLKRLKLISNEVVGKSVFDVYKNSPAIVNAIEKSLKGDNVNFESRVGNASYDNYVVPYSGTNELFNGVLGVALDITERKEAEQHLKESEIMFRDLFTRMSEGFAYHEVIYNAHHKAVDYKILEVNQGFENHTGISVKEAKGALASQLYGTKSAPYLDVFSKVASSGEYKILEYYFPPLDRYFEISVFSSEPGYFATIFTNITQRKKTEQELRYNENRLKSIFDTVGDIIFLIDVEKDGEYRFATVNQMFSNATGVPKELIIGKRVRDVIPEPSLTLTLSKYREAIKKKNIVRWEDITRYPSITLTGEASVVPMFDDDGNCIHLVVAFHDITGRKKMEEDLRLSREEFQHYFEFGAVGLTVTLPDKKWAAVNRKLCELFGYSREELLGMTWADLTHPDDLALNLDLFQQTLDGKIDHFETDKKFIRKDGQIVYATLSSVCVRNEDGSVHHLLSSYIDITHRTKAEDEVKNSEIRYRRFI
jgi:PAS domain S-box-containing protein